MKLSVMRAALIVGAGLWSGAGQATTYFGYCWDSESFHYYSTTFTFEGDGSEYDELVDQWKERLSQSQSMPTYKFSPKCYAATDSATVEEKYRSLMRGWDNNPSIIQFSPMTAATQSASTTSRESSTQKPPSTAAKSEPKDRSPAAAQGAEDYRKKRQEEHAAVEARNRDNQAKYEAELAEQKRQVDEFERAKEEVARKKIEQQAAAKQALDAFKAEQERYAEEVRRHQQEVIDYQGKLPGQPQAEAKSGTGGKFQATSGFLDTREAALASLNKHPAAANGLTDVQCQEVTFYTPPKWTCWGFYRQEVKPAAASAQ